MHHFTKAFYYMFSTGSKNDFYGGCLYLKYMNQFVSKVPRSLTRSWLRPKMRAEDILSRREDFIHTSGIVTPPLVTMCLK